MHSHHSGIMLSTRQWHNIQRDYRRNWTLTPRRVTCSGMSRDVALDPLGTIPVVVEARRRAVAESLRWGEPSVFLLADGVVSWVVALVDGETLCGGICGGEVVVGEALADTAMVARHLAHEEASCSRVNTYLSALPVWPQKRVQDASVALQECVYAISGLKPVGMQRNRADALQQRQIAEAIHQGKTAAGSGWHRIEERQLLQLIRVGDLGGARRLLNRLLAGMFLDEPRLPVLQARVLELLGYLVRLAVEDAPECAILMATHHAWIARIMATDGFESLCVTVRDALDDFMAQVALQGLTSGARHVRRALALAEAALPRVLSLEEAARAIGISRFRLAHLVKEATGLSFGRHVARLRIERACYYLTTTSMRCAEIAAELAFTDQSHFTRVFRCITGTTPARYRRG